MISTPNPLRSDSPPSVPTWALLSVITVAYLLNIIPEALYEPWRVDEFYSRQMAAFSVPEMISRTKQDLHPPLYYLLLMFARAIVAQEWIWRGMSVFAGWCTLMLAYASALRIGGRRMAVYYSLVLAFMPMFLFYAKEVRMYVFTLMIIHGVLVAWLWHEKYPRLAGVVACLLTITAMYTHNFGALSLGCFASTLLIRELIRARKNEERDIAWREIQWLILSFGLPLIAYIPWLIVVASQIREAPLEQMFIEPLFIEKLAYLFAYPFSMGLMGGSLLAAWLIGIVSLIILPIRALRGNRFRESRQWLFPVLGLGYAPFLALIVISAIVRPIIAYERHIVLFLPFALMPLAYYLSAFASGRIMRGMFYSLLGLLGLLANRSSFTATNFDYRICRDALAEKAPLDLPVLAFPPKFQFGGRQLMWQEKWDVDLSIPLAVPKDISACTLIVFYGPEHVRERVMDRVRVVLSRIPDVQVLMEDRLTTIYRLEGIPVGVMQELIESHDTSPQQRMLGLVGPWEIIDSYSNSGLDSICDPPGTESTFRFSIPSRSLPPDGFILHIPASQPTEPEEPLAQAVIIGRPAGKGLIKIASGASSGIESIIMMHDDAQLIARWAPSSEVASWHIAAKGDEIEELHLIWAGEIAVPRESLIDPISNATTIKVGVLGDEIFLRSGFHVREGIGNDHARWTLRSFSCDVPVLPDQSISGLAIEGILPPQIEGRLIECEVIDLTTGETITRGRGEASGFEHASHAIVLDAPVGSGFYRLNFKLSAYWIPLEYGVGGDPRQLGMRIHSLSLLNNKAAN